MKPIFLVGEAFGANEVRTQTPFVGASGVELLHMLSEAGVITLTSEDYAFISRYWAERNPALIDVIWKMHPEVYRTNVFNLHPAGNKIDELCGTKQEALHGYPALAKSKYIRAEFKPELDRLAAEVEKYKPNLIVCLGNTPLWAFSGIVGISKLRGTTRESTLTAPGYKILPTYHPAAVLRQWELRPVTVTDLHKVTIEAKFPEVRRPSCQIWIEPTLQDLETFYRDHIVGCKILSVDIETAADLITCIGFAPTPSLSLVLPFFDGRKQDKSYWRTKSDEVLAWAWVRKILADPSIKKVFQNGLYDIAFIARTTKIPVLGAAHDTMLLHHALQPEALKGLGFLGSVYTSHGPWKTERKGNTTIKRDA